MNNQQNNNKNGHGLSAKVFSIFAVSLIILAAVIIIVPVDASSDSKDVANVYETSETLVLRGENYNEHGLSWDSDSHKLVMNNFNMIFNINGTGASLALIVLAGTDAEMDFELIGSNSITIVLSDTSKIDESNVSGLNINTGTIHIHGNGSLAVNMDNKEGSTSKISSVTGIHLTGTPTIDGCKITVNIPSITTTYPTGTTSIMGIALIGSDTNEYQIKNSVIKTTIGKFNSTTQSNVCGMNFFHGAPNILESHISIDVAGDTSNADCAIQAANSTVSITKSNVRLNSQSKSIAIVDTATVTINDVDKVLGGETAGKTPTIQLDPTQPIDYSKYPVLWIVAPFPSESGFDWLLVILSVFTTIVIASVVAIAFRRE